MFTALSHVRTPLAPRDGNSDPFDAYAVQLGPSEHSLLQLYTKSFVPALYGSRPANMVRPLADIQEGAFVGCLHDEAAAYALLSREAAINGLLVLRERYTAPSVPSLDYMVRSQAVLCRRLSLMDGSETPDMMFHVLSTISHLASAEVMAASATANLHVRALHQLMARFAEVAGPLQLQKASLSIIAVIFGDTIKAYLCSTRPTINLSAWSPYLGRETSREESSASLLTEDSGSDHHAIHRAVEDDTLKLIISKQRELVQLYHDSKQKDMSHMEILLLSVALNKEVLDVNQLLHIAAEAEFCLLNLGLDPEQVQRQCVRASVSLAMLLWSQLVLPTSLVVNIIFDVAPPTLQRLRSAILTSQFVEKEMPELGRAYKETRLWTLSVGVHVELHRKEKSGAYTACGEWFLETFREEAKSMDVRSWQQGVSIFDQFLYSEQIKPRMAHWWDRIVCSQTNARRTRHTPSRAGIENA